MLATSDIQSIPILQHPIIMYKFLSPDWNETCSIKLYNDKTYVILYVKSIAFKLSIGKQLRTPSLTQQHLIAIKNGEPIDAASASENSNNYDIDMQKE